MQTTSKELTYKIIGCIYSVYNQLGFGHREVVYQRALAQEITIVGLDYKKELYLPIKYNNKVISRYYIDFVIEDTVVLELKVGNEFLENYRKQALAYLKQSKYKLAMVAVISPKNVIIKRVII